MYDTEEEAAKAYDDAAVEHFGDKAKRNFDDDGQMIDYNDAANKGRGASKRRRAAKGAKGAKTPTATARAASPSPSPSAGTGWAGPIAELELNADYAYPTSAERSRGGGMFMFDGVDEDGGDGGHGDYGASSYASAAIANGVRPPPPPPPPPTLQMGATNPMGGPIPVAVAMKKKGAGATERKIKSVPPGMRKHLTAAQKGRLGDSGANSPPPDADAAGGLFDSGA